MAKAKKLTPEQLLFTQMSKKLQQLYCKGTISWKEAVALHKKR